MNELDKKKKVAIISIYYKSCNYGGNLQAYALAKQIEKLGFSAEQLCHYENKRAKLTHMLTHRPLEFVTKAAVKIIRKPYDMVRSRPVRAIEKKYRVTERRTAAFADFNRNVIPHSREVYEINTISAAAERYDVFVTGSDQVWNLNWYNPIFFLDFVSSDKTKLSYAASLAMDSLTAQQRRVVKKSLADYRAVSVREENAVKLIGELSPVPVEFVADPTLLLEKEDWDGICSDRVVEEEYVFCYFLGENKKARSIARDFAGARGLKLVNIPHAGGRIKICDECFGDLQLYDATPQDFISLIKHAAFVFTDSFHATVFSGIYQRQYFIFNRSAKAELSSRIYSITKLFGSECRFCSTGERETLEYALSLPAIDYARENTELEALKRRSREFLITNLGK